MSTPPGPRILYVTADGLLTPLGSSQILAYIRRLVPSGFRYHIVSLEPAAAFSSPARDTLAQELAALGISWTAAPFRTGGAPTQILANARALLRAVRRVLRTEPVDLLHARAFVPAVLSWLASRRTRVPYLFDMRGYWVDERKEEHRIFHHPWAYRIGKAVERRLVRDAAAVVTLTQLQATHIAPWRRRENRAAIHVIPTCADYDVFRADGPDTRPVPPEIDVRLAGKLVIGFVGSLNASYKVTESLAFFQHLLALRPDAHLLCVSTQTADLLARLQASGLPEASYTVVSSLHAAMPSWLRRMHWGLLLLNSSFAKTASVPTKLAEFLAAGVRPILSGCNTEVCATVAGYGFGLVLPSSDHQNLQSAAAKVAAATLQTTDAAEARGLSAPSFDLERGASRYRAILLDHTRAAGSSGRGEG